MFFELLVSEFSAHSFVLPETVSQLLWIIHINHYENFSSELLSTEEIAPMKIVHNILSGLSRVAETLVSPPDVTKGLPGNQR